MHIQLYISKHTINSKSSQNGRKKTWIEVHFQPWLIHASRCTVVLRSRQSCSCDGAKIRTTIGVVRFGRQFVSSDDSSQATIRPKFQKATIRPKRQFSRFEKTTIRPICKKRQLVPTCFLISFFYKLLKIEIKEWNK